MRASFATKAMQAPIRLEPVVRGFAEACEEAHVNAIDVRKMVAALALALVG